MDFQDRVIQGVRRRLKERGYGSIKEAQKYIGIGDSFFKDLWRGQCRLDIGRLGMIFEFLEVEPEDFFREELRDPIDVLLGDIKEENIPEAVRMLGSQVDECAE